MLAYALRLKKHNERISHYAAVCMLNFREGIHGDLFPINDQTKVSE